MPRDTVARRCRNARLGNASYDMTDARRSCRRWSLSGSTRRTGCKTHKTNSELEFNNTTHTNSTIIICLFSFFGGVICSLHPPQKKERHSHALAIDWVLPITESFIGESPGVPPPPQFVGASIAQFAVAGAGGRFNDDGQRWSGEVSVSPDSARRGGVICSSPMSFSKREGAVERV